MEIIVAEPKSLKSCPCCGLVHELPPIPSNRVARCTRCDAVIHSPRSAALGNRRAMASALAALILFPVAITLPVMHIERFGVQRDASVWSGSLGLLSEGEWLVGSVVLVCSIVLPLVKLLGILSLTATSTWMQDKHRAFTYHWIERAGRWGMLDVLLISVVVAWLKLGDMVEVRPGPGALAFTGCVLLSLVASACFDPHSLWLRSGGLQTGTKL